MRISTHKQARLQAIVDRILELAEAEGRSEPGRDRAGSNVIRLAISKRCEAIITPDKRIAFGRITQSINGERFFEVKGSTMIEVKVDGGRVLALNLENSKLDLYFDKPGLWEEWLGLPASADTEPFSAIIFPDRHCPDWAAYLQSKDYARGVLRHESATLIPPKPMQVKKRKPMLGYGYSS